MSIKGNLLWLEFKLQRWYFRLNRRFMGMRSALSPNFRTVEPVKDQKIILKMRWLYFIGKDEEASILFYKQWSKELLEYNNTIKERRSFRTTDNNNE